MAEDAVHDVAKRLLASARKSLGRLSRSTCQKAGLHANRFTAVQELKQPVCEKRMTYCRSFRTFIDENSWFSDEAWFHLSGYVNPQNTRLWGGGNPRGTPPFPENRRVLCVITATNNWAHVLRHNCNKSSAHWLFREFANQLDDQELTLGYFQKATHKHGWSRIIFPRQRNFTRTMAFSGTTFEWDTLYIYIYIYINIWNKTTNIFQIRHLNRWDQGTKNKVIWFDFVY
jgi:hypothetical protein